MMLTVRKMALGIEILEGIDTWQYVLCTLKSVQSARANHTRQQSSFQFLFTH